ncbi:hypothetical protein V2G26_006480 [Clonostachys chloroleuca]
MSQQVQTQVDVGSLSLRGFGLFTDMLAVLSADNVTPMAMIQMEQLGSLFHVNGRFATKVPELLTRASSHPIGRLTLAVGWRRGDSVSLLAESAGGQAMSLLSLCITNIYNEEAVGQILSRLSSRLLPRSSPHAGVVPLADVAALVASKLNRFGFGNVLAEQTMRVHSVFEKLETTIPDGLLELPSVESLTDVFECLSHLRRDDTVIRISGSPGILYLLSIVIFMFPHDAIVSVESYVIHEGEAEGRIIIEICDSAPVQVQVEKKLSQSAPLILPMKVCEDGRKIKGACSFAWEGWIARKLQIEFARVGATCTQEVLVACCSMITHLAEELKLFKHTGISQEVKFETLLGLYPANRIDRICREVFLAPAEKNKSDAKTALERLSSIVTPILEGVKCQPKKRCTSCSHGWSSFTYHGAWLDCPSTDLWETVGNSLTAGLYCLLINAHGLVSVPGILPSLDKIRDILYSTQGLNRPNSDRRSPNILEDVMRLIHPSGSLGRSSGACTIYPTNLETLKVDPDRSFTFEIHDGVLVYENRYHQCLTSDPASRPLARVSPASDLSHIIPSSHGEHSSVGFTLREGYKKLILSTTIHGLGRSSRIDLETVIAGSMWLERTHHCGHRLDSPLVYSKTSTFIDNLVVTDVMNPKARSALSLVMVRSNSLAQFLCCEVDFSCLLIKGTCLNCAIEQADGNFNILIIT